MLATLRGLYLCKPESIFIIQEEVVSKLDVIKIRGWDCGPKRIAASPPLFVKRFQYCQRL